MVKQNQSLKSSKNFSILALALFALAFAVIGIKLIVSHAIFVPINSTAVGFFNYAVANPDGTKVFNATDPVPGLGLQTVTGIAPGQKMTYSYFNGKVSPKNICYFVKALSSYKSSVQVGTIPAQFVGVGAAITSVIAVDNNYHSVCVPSNTSTTSTTQLPYNVYNESAYGYLLVYQAFDTF